ncbi:MAG TPA: prefoldin subunit beta [Candidatus Nanoarchaeia archaeon]|nr:prefoldin subunit beta [Candidatus Nanoarchaeia archaeon]
MEDPTVKNKINEIQLIEQRMNNLLQQKQTFQSQLTEVENATNELEKSNGKSYKIIGPIMIESSKEDLKNNLLDKKKILDLRIKTFEKQEDKLKEKAKKLQQEVMNDMKEQGN